MLKQLKLKVANFYFKTTDLLKNYIIFLTKFIKNLYI